MPGAEGAKKVVLVEDRLGSISNVAEFGELSGQRREGGVVADGVSVLAFVKGVLDIGGEVTEELLGKGAGPCRDGGGGTGVEGGDERAELVEDLRGGVEGFLAGGRVEASGGKLPQCVEDGLSGGVVADSSAYIIRLEEGAEASEVTSASEHGQRVVVRDWGQGGGLGWISGRPSCGNGGPEFRREGNGAIEEVEVTVILGVVGGGRGGDGRSHGGRDGWGGSASGGSSRVNGGVVIEFLGVLSGFGFVGGFGLAVVFAGGGSSRIQGKARGFVGGCGGGVVGEAGRELKDERGGLGAERG